MAAGAIGSDGTREMEALAAAVEVVVGGAAVADENSPGVREMCEALEAVLRHGLREKGTWLSGRKDYYHFLAHAKDKSAAAAATLASEAATFGVATPEGKGRAFLRAALLEQRLAEYVALVADDIWLASEWYEAHALVRSPLHRKRLVDILTPLNTVVFAFCVKDVSLDESWGPLSPAPPPPAASPTRCRRRRLSASGSRPPLSSGARPARQRTGAPQRRQPSQRRTPHSSSTSRSRPGSS